MKSKPVKVVQLKPRRRFHLPKGLSLSVSEQVVGGVTIALLTQMCMRLAEYYHLWPLAGPVVSP
jgi:hypothetical protein